MARIVIAWELGEAFGHLARCLRLSEALIAHGHVVTLVLKDIRMPGGFVPRSEITVVPAPLTPQASRVSRTPVNYAEMLGGSGFSDFREVAARLNAWQGLFSLIKPDLLLADHAPTALLAAFLADVPHLSIGNGFPIPPDVYPWPSIRPWEDIPEVSLSAAEAVLDGVIAASIKAIGISKEVRTRNLFSSCDILDTFEELDHYGPRPGGLYVGPIVSVPKAMRVGWQSQSGPKVLAYLRPGVPGFLEILKSLVSLDAEVICIAPGIGSDLARRCATTRLRIALSPVELPPLLEVADLAVGYGNSGFSTQCLLAGVPLAMRPRHVEQLLFAKRVEAISAGQILDGQLLAEGVSASLQQLLVDPSCREAAIAFRDRHAGFSTREAVDRSVFAIERVLLASNQPQSHLTSPESLVSSPTCLH